MRKLAVIRMTATGKNNQVKVGEIKKERGAYSEEAIPISTSILYSTSSVIENIGKRTKKRLPIQRPENRR